MTAKPITPPRGAKLAILPSDEFEDLGDRFASAAATADCRAGRKDGLTLDDVDARLAAPAPLAFWRAKRGMTQAKLAETAGTTHIADLESGKQDGSLDQMARIAKALRVKLDDLAPAE